MKKPDAVTVISRENFREKVWGLPVSDLLFVGKNTAEKLRSSGVHTIGDITCCDDEMLVRLLGINGKLLKSYALGEDKSPVVTPTDDYRPKSIGRSVTRAYNFETNEQVWREFLIFSEEICKTLREKGMFACGVQVHIRTVSLQIKEFSHTFPESTDCVPVLAKHGFELFTQNYSFKEPLRSVGLRAINLKEGRSAVQTGFFTDIKKEIKLEQLEDSIHLLRKKFGDKSIKRGTVI